MTVTGRGTLLLALLALALPGAARAGDWFVPPPAPAAGRSAMDVTLGRGTENVTVIAARPSRTWRSVAQDEHLNDPRASDAMHPAHSFQHERPYCNSALRTVGGQPATAGEMMTGVGAGRC